MSGIAKIDAWFDCGYSETSVEIPPKGHVLREPDLTLEGPFNPSKNREFSEVRVELPFVEAVNISYLRLHYDFNNGDDQVFYAWVDDVRLISDSVDAPMVNILFHIDPWRTWNDKLTYGSGFVQRRPSTASDYWQNYPFRFLKENNVFDLIKSEFKYKEEFNYWVLIVQQWQDGDISRIRYSTFPIKDFSSEIVMSKRDLSDHCIAPHIFDVLYARFDELFGWDPKTITGAWLSPVNPIHDALYGDGTEANPLRVDNRVADPGWEVQVNDKEGRKYGWFETEKQVRWNPFVFSEFELPIDRFVSTEQNQVKLIGPMDEIIGSVPFGILSDDKITLTVVASSTSAFLRFSLGKMSEGMVFDYVLPSIDINENCWSSYVYSGQRDYENNMRNIQTWSSAVSGAAEGGGMGALIGGVNNIGTAGGNASKSAMGLEKILGGAGAGALMGGPAGAIAGAVIGAGASIIGGVIQGEIFDPQIRAEEDKLHSKQANAIILSGQPIYLLKKGDAQVKIGFFIFDDESNAAIEANKAVQGVKFGQNMEDCNALIDGGGPMQISNLITHGNAPVLAKKAIQAKFAKGVRIIAR